MSTRIRVSVGILVAAVAVIAYTAGGVAGQQAPSATAAQPAGSTYKAPRTPDGQPDLQGFWTNATLTPLQRPANVTTEFVTKEEFEKNVARRASADEEQTEPGTTADVHYDFTQFALDKTQSPITANGYRTSLIVDPSDGRIPTIAAATGGGRGAGGRGGAAAGGRGGAAGRGARGGGGPRLDRVQDMPLGTRCIVSGGAGPPLMDAGYNANYQIVQSVGTVMILTEMIHDARIIPLDDRPAPPDGYRGWMGASRGRWEGDTLVVETSNFNGRRPFQGSTDKLRVIERFTRTAADQITYRFTVEDPSVWSRPWTAEEILQSTNGPIFEHACHEGNYGVANTLAGARLAEKEAAAKAGSQ
jgi:hypothetical protein